MKKDKLLFIGIMTGFVLLLALTIWLFAGERFRILTNDKGANQRQVLWSITGTAADTSMTFKSAPVMTIFTWAADTTVDDSVSYTLSLQTQGAHGWYTFKTTTVTAESTDANWLITNTAVPSGYLLRLIVTGGAANSKTTPSLAKFTFDSGN